MAMGKPPLAVAATIATTATPGRFHGNVETCGADGVDEDCDFDTSGARDADRDGENSSACFNWGPPPR